MACLVRLTDRRSDSPGRLRSTGDSDSVGSESEGLAQGVDFPGTMCHNGCTMIVDFHAHIFSPDIVRRRTKLLQRDAWFGTLYQNPRAKMATADELVSSMDQAGVDASVAFGFAWRDPERCREHNDYVLTSMRQHPGRILGFACVNPLCGTEAIAEIERCAGEGMLGVGELMPDGQGYSLDDAGVMRPLMTCLADHRMPLLVHTSEPVGHSYHGKGTITPDKVYAFVRQYPETDIVLAHWGGGLPFYELMEEVRKACARVYYDTAASLFLYDDRVFRLATSLVGDRVLWGTDYPLIGHGRFRRRVEAAGLSPGSLEGILGGNAARLLGLSGGEPHLADSQAHP